jgi:hypothetical protein
MVILAIKQADIIMGRKTGQLVKDSHLDNLRMASDARNEIFKFLDYLPIDIRTHYKRYDEQFGEIIKKIIEGKIGKEDVMQYLDKMKSLALKITNLTDSILRKKLD